MNKLALDYTLPSECLLYCIEKEGMWLVINEAKADIMGLISGLEIFTVDGQNTGRQHTPFFIFKYLSFPESPQYSILYILYRYRYL
jgi:hypothetical protein